MASPDDEKEKRIKAMEAQIEELMETVNKYETIDYALSQIKNVGKFEKREKFWQGVAITAVSFVLLIAFIAA